MTPLTPDEVRQWIDLSRRMIATTPQEVIKETQMVFALLNWLIAAVERQLGAAK